MQRNVDPNKGYRDWKGAPGSIPAVLYQMFMSIVNNWGFLRRLATVVSTMEEAARAEVHRSGDTLLLERYATESWNSGCQKKGKEV